MAAFGPCRTILAASLEPALRLGSSMRLALYEPDIPQNTGTILRLAACLGLPVDIIAPTGFDMTDRTLRRAGLDYLAHVDLTRHRDFAAFESTRRQASSRLVLLSTRAEIVFTAFAFRPGDTLLLGRESAGVPDAVHAAADARVRIPMRAGMRSLNVAMAAAMVVGEALRQTSDFS
jgi:tRNA (cytidine/uridine-2'-O-)-methyltransferase